MTDPDRKKVTWEHLYRHIYTEDRWSFWGLIDFEKVEYGAVGFKSQIAWAPSNQRFKDYVDKSRRYEEKLNEGFSLSGDADFQLKERQIGQQIGNKHLETHMHMFKNFSVMPRKGSMNNKKGQKWFPEFIDMLRRYYDNGDISLLYRASTIPDMEKAAGDDTRHEARKSMLDGYLKLFDGLYDYCEKIYLIPSSFVDCLLDAYRRDPNVNEYLSLAWQYFQIRESAMRNLIPAEDHHWLLLDIGSEAFE